jgi:hypothetical protein
MYNFYSEKSSGLFLGDHEQQWFTGRMSIVFVPFFAHLSVIVAVVE